MKRKTAACNYKATHRINNERTTALERSVVKPSGSLCIQRTVVITTAFVPQDVAVKKNLPLYRITTCTRIINYKTPFSPYLLQETCYGYLLESPHWGDSNKYPQHMFLGLLNTIILNISNCLPQFELRNCSILIVVITNFVVISNVSIKRADCLRLSYNPERKGILPLSDIQTHDN